LEASLRWSKISMHFFIPDSPTLAPMLNQINLLHAIECCFIGGGLGLYTPPTLLLVLSVVSFPRVSRPNILKHFSSLQCLN
jgi:hypothetical protein